MKVAIGNSKLLIIDESYGAHFYFSQQCPYAALEGGADAAVTSAFESLGATYGSAILNVNKQS
jgi:hypothetical protein